jgi:hypothetical protein
MSITLTVGATVLALDPDLLWTDEFSWHPVEQAIERTVTGAQIISIGTRVGGRPITLQPEDDSSAWMSAAAVLQLKAWTSVAGQELQLDLRGEERTVVFRHQDTPMEATPVIHFNDLASEDWYRVTLRFMEI